MNAEIAAIALIACACQHEPERLQEPPSAPGSPHSIPAARLNGKLHGHAFQLGDARYYVDRRLGYEKIDILLSAASAGEACGSLEPARAASVWLRRSGTTEPIETTARLELNQKAEWEVHYQVHEEDGWAGSSSARALLVVHAPHPDLTLEGDLSACFRDETGSCVSGHFKAHHCPIRIDAPVRGTQAMERPKPEALPQSAADAGSDTPKRADAGAPPTQNQRGGTP